MSIKYIPVFAAGSTKFFAATNRFMTTVMAQGVFDIIHPGHLQYFRASVKHGDRLVVVIARDSRIDKNTYFNEEERREMVSSLEIVDEAVLGSEEDIYETVREVDPDVITLGYDQKHSVEDVKKMAEGAVEHNVKVVRIDAEYPDYSSSDIRRLNR